MRYESLIALFVETCPILEHALQTRTPTMKQTRWDLRGLDGIEWVCEGFEMPDSGRSQGCGEARQDAWVGLGWAAAEAISKATPAEFAGIRSSTADLIRLRLGWGSLMSLFSRVVVDWALKPESAKGDSLWAGSLRCYKCQGASCASLGDWAKRPAACNS